MTRWFRFIWAYLAALAMPRVGAHDVVTQRARAWPFDCEASLMNHTALLVLCEATRIELMVRSGFFRMARTRRWYFPTSAIYAHYVRPVPRFAKVTVTGRVAGWDDDEIWIAHEVIVDGKRAARVAMRGVFREAREKVAPTHIAAALWPGEESPVMPSWVEAIRAGDAAARAHAL